MVKNRFLFFFFAFFFYNFAKGSDFKVHEITIDNENFYVYVSTPKNTKYKTLVFLPSYSFFIKPHKDFSPLTNELKNKYQIVVVEYYGYNNSDDTLRSRSADNICEEVSTALKKLNIKKYILVPHSISGLYALYYLQKNKDEVEGIIGIDISLPYYFLEECSTEEEYKKHPFKDKDKVTNAFANQYTYFWRTSKLLENFKFNKDFHVLLFISTELIKNMDIKIQNGIYKTKPIDYLNTIITNKQKQSIKILKGRHFLHYDQSKNIAKEIDMFVDNLYKNKNNTNN